MYNGNSGMKLAKIWSYEGREFLMKDAIHLTLVKIMQKNLTTKCL